MKKCRITVMKMARYDDLIEKYENPIEHACDIVEGQTFLSVDGQKPQELCESAWHIPALALATDFISKPSVLAKASALTKPIP